MRASVAALLLLLAACGGGGSGSGGSAPPCGAGCAASASFLDEADVQRVIAQAVGEAQARGVRAHVAVVDRVGNVLGVFRMTGAPATVAISSGLGVTGGLDGIPAGIIPAELAAISKAITGAYLSSGGNAFSTRTAGQIVQQHFDPNESQQPSGPLYGVQFSQLSCSDVNRNASQGTIGPKRSPLGLAADPGGLPLYKGGVLVGGIGIEADGRYGLDLDITDFDTDAEELIAVAGSSGFAAPADIRGDRITADGRVFHYVDSEAIVSDPPHASAFASLPGTLANVDGYNAGAIRAGTAFGSPASGMREDRGFFQPQAAWVLVDANDAVRFPLRGATDAALGTPEVQQLLVEAFAIAKRARGQIRRPLGSSAEVTIAVVDRAGEILGLIRSDDAPVFGIDVAVQKARTAMFFSHPAAAAELASLPPARYLSPAISMPIAPYVDSMRAFLGDPAALTGTIAWTPRAIGNIHRPLFPDGIDGTPAGPLSTPIARWSPFNVGFQLDIVYNQLVKGVLGDTTEGCTGLAKLRNGAQIFPGGVPIYRGGALAGAIGVSGDGVDQDDMVAFLGLANASRALGGTITNAPAAMRADTLTPLGVRLRYAQCPQAPFNGSTEQNACAGL